MVIKLVFQRLEKWIWKDMEVLKMGFFLLIIIVLGVYKLISEISTETKVTHNIDRTVKQNAEEIKKFCKWFIVGWKIYRWKTERIMLEWYIA